MSNRRPSQPTTSEQTDSREEADAVRAKGGIFVKAVEATRVAMLVTDATLPGNPVIFANSAFLAMSGYAMDDILGRDPHFLDGPDTDPATIRRFKGAVAERRDETLEILQYRKDGSTLWAALFVGPWADEQDQVAYHFLSFLDITRRFEAEEELRRLARSLEERVTERTQELTALNARLSRLLAENDVLLHEVDHRAKNSLAIASSLLITQAYQQSDPMVRDLFLDTQERLNAMAHAHDLLSKSKDPRQLGFAPYLRDLCRSLTEAASHDGRIRIEVKAPEDIQILTDQAIVLGLLVNELVTNAMKHAFPPPMTGLIQVAVRRLPSGRVELQVRDDGVGMSAGRQGSLGYGIIHSLVGQIDGDIEVGCEGGVAATVSFPV